VQIVDLLFVENVVLGKAKYRTKTTKC